jgi:elongation factor Ts
VARTDDFQTLGRDVAMQVAAASPIVVGRDDIPEADLERERDIFKNQALKSGKPEKVIDKIIEGKLEKFYSESVLLEQSFIKDDKLVVGDLLKEIIGKLGENIIIKRFVRFQLGEETS